MQGKRYKKYYENDQYRETVNLLNKYINSDSENIEAYKIRGNSYFELNQLPYAINDFKKAIEIDPNYTDAHYNLAGVYEELEQLDSAEYHLRSYISLQANDPNGYLRLGMNLAMQGNSGSTLTLYEQAYKLDTTSLISIQVLMEQYFIEKLFEKSIEFSKRAKTIDPALIDAYITHGKSALYSWNFKTAIEQSDQALEIDSLNFDAYLLGLNARIMDRTNPDILFMNTDMEFKFKNSGSVIDNQGTLSDTESLLSKIKQGEILGLDEYFQFYVSQQYSKSFSPYLPSGPEIPELFRDESFEELCKYTSGIFKDNPLNLDHLYMVGVANMASDDTENFKLLYSAYLGIMESILATGSGESYDSALVVVSAHDEYSVLSYLGLQPKGQALSHHNGHSYDILSTVDQQQNEQEVYFNIDIPWKSLSTTFSNGSDSKKKTDRKRKKQ